MEPETERPDERRKSPWREVVGALLRRMEEEPDDAATVRDWNEARAKGASPGRRY